MKALVTGGGGFLGGAIVRRLLDRGDEVRNFSRGAYPELESAGVECVQGDLADADAVSNAVKGCDVVFHVAAKAGVWGWYADYYRTNAQGTQHVIDACRNHKISRLVYTSTPSVVFHGEDEEGADESLPYPETFQCNYARTKAEAEQKVLAFNDKNFATIALRPHLIWGPGDPNLVPRIVERAKRGALRLVGGGSNKVDSTYIDNAAAAHVLAADKLEPGAECAGKAYFITNGEPLPIKDLINRILDAAGIEPVEKSIAPEAAYVLGAGLEFVYGLFGVKTEPPMTRFVAAQLATAHWYDISAAKNDLGYEPEVSIAEGMERLRAFFATDAAPTPEPAVTS